MQKNLYYQLLQYILGSSNHTAIELSTTVTIPLGNATKEQGKMQK